MIKAHWQAIIEQEQKQPYFKKLMKDITRQRKQGVAIFPLDKDVFNAFTSVDLPEVKVVILGQDPYHGESNGLPQAHGLAFSVVDKVKVPPSLVNIYKELTTDIEGFTIPNHGYLQAWADQGVLLLNTVLTVEQAKAHSHSKLGWETFTDAIIANINQQNAHCVFILWGAHAQKKGRQIDRDKHLVLSGAHPSPLSAYRGFYGSKPFSTANSWLKNKGLSAIDWRLNDR